MKCPFKPFQLQTKLIDDEKLLPEDIRLTRYEVEFTDCYEEKCAAWGFSKEEGKSTCMLCRRGV